MKKLVIMIVLLLSIVSPVAADTENQNTCFADWQSAVGNYQFSAMTNNGTNLLAGATVGEDVFVVEYSIQTQELVNCSKYSAEVRIEDLVYFQDQAYAALSGDAGFGVWNVFPSFQPEASLDVRQAYDFQYVDNDLFVSTSTGVYNFDGGQNIDYLGIKDDPVYQVLQFRNDHFLVSSLHEGVDQLIFVQRQRVVHPIYRQGQVTDYAVWIENDTEVVLMISDNGLSGYFSYPGSNPLEAQEFNNATDVVVSGDKVVLATESGLFEATLSEIYFETERVQSLYTGRVDQVEVVGDTNWIAGPNGFMAIQ